MLSALRMLRQSDVTRHTAVAGAYKHWSDTLRRGSSLAPAAPGTVQAYDQHLFIEPGGMTPTDWSKTVERTPAILGAFSALARRKDDITGTVKVTAYASHDASAAASSGTCTAMLFPAGLEFSNLQPGDFEAVVDNHIVDTPPKTPAWHAGSVAELQGLHLFVCSHGTRDARCGKLGPPLARRLRTLATSRGLLDSVRVYECSHVGGHKYAGNVLVYGAISPNEGDWFGGVSADDAEELLTALTEIEIGSEGGFDHPTLRKWWRGRMGLSKDQQRECFEQCALCGGSDSEEGFSDEDPTLEVEPRQMRQ